MELFGTWFGIGLVVLLFSSGLPHPLGLTGTVSASELCTDFDFSRAMYGEWSIDELPNISFDAFYRTKCWLCSDPDYLLKKLANESLEAAAEKT